MCGRIALVASRLVADLSAVVVSTNVINEAYNQGVPVIATNSVGAVAGGLVQDGLDGLVVPARNSGALAQALESILEESSLRQCLGQSARQTIAEWSQERMAMSFCQAVAYVARQQERGLRKEPLVPPDSYQSSK